MVKTRIAPRFRIAKPARIEYDREKIDCVVRDLSATGSALEVANAGAIPVKFALVVPEDPQATTTPSAFKAKLDFEPAATATTFDSPEGTLVWP
jgi:hypothetical protein